MSGSIAISIRSRLTLLVATLLVAGLTPAMASGLAHPRDAAEVFVKATAAGDADAIAALYAPDAVFLAPDTPVISGRDRIRSLFARNFAAGPNTIAFSDIRVDGEGTRAVVLWEWVSEVRPADRDPIRLAGRSLVYFVKGQTGWQISADMLQVMSSR